MKQNVLACTFILVLALALASCSGVNAPDILTTSTILADVTRNVVGNQYSVGSLLPLGVDPHSYQPTPQDTAKISESKVLVINGAEYEAFLGSLIKSADGTRPVINASAGLRLLTDTQNGTGVDPHLWLDPTNVISYVENIREGLVQFDPAGAEAERVPEDGEGREGHGRRRDHGLTASPKEREGSTFPPQTSTPTRSPTAARLSRYPQHLPERALRLPARPMTPAAVDLCGSCRASRHVHLYAGTHETSTRFLEPFSQTPQRAPCTLAVRQDW